MPPLNEMSRQLKKGILEILLLQLLQGEAAYGYELMQRLSGRSDGYFTMKEGTLYPILYRLEDSGYIQSVWEETRDRRGAQRKYYSMTERGRDYLGRARDELKQLIAATKKIMGGEM